MITLPLWTLLNLIIALAGCCVLLIRARAKYRTDIALMNERLQDRTQTMLAGQVRAHQRPSAPSFRAGWNARDNIYKPMSCVPPNEVPTLERCLRHHLHTTHHPTWESLNNRRLDLIEKKLARTLHPAESLELADLKTYAIQYIRHPQLATLHQPTWVPPVTTANHANDGAAVPLTAGHRKLPPAE